MGCCSSKPSDDTTGDDGSAERKPATNAARPETNISTARTDITQFESSGRAAEGGESLQPPAARHPTRGSTREARPQTLHEGSNLFKIPGQPPDFSLASRRPLEEVRAWDRTGQLKERTKPTFQGTFSDVSQAKLADRTVAVKTLRLTNIKSDEESRIWKRLAKEIRQWATLDHPNVLQFLGFAIEDEKPCLISPWCDNGTLPEYLQRVPDANRRRLVREVAEGLKYLHQQTPPIVHGDLKTTNVFVTGDNTAKISDFGSPRLFGQLRTGFTTSGSVPTTTRYSAPEILRDGLDPTLHSNVFSFAYIALETMTSKWPFWKTSTDRGIVDKVVYEKQTPSPEDHPGVEEAIWELLRKCWNYEPSDRPGMGDVCKMLSDAGYKPSILFYPPPRAGPSNPRVGQLSRPSRSTKTV